MTVQLFFSGVMNEHEPSAPPCPAAARPDLSPPHVYLVFGLIPRTHEFHICPKMPGLGCCSWMLMRRATWAGSSGLRLWSWRPAKRGPRDVEPGVDDMDADRVVLGTLDIESIEPERSVLAVLPVGESAMVRG